MKEEELKLNNTKEIIKKPRNYETERRKKHFMNYKNNYFNRMQNK